MKTIMITGGAGFIGSALIRFLIKEKEIRIINVDNLTYAGHLETLQEVSNNPLYLFRKADICDKSALQSIFQEFHPIGVIHLAAESHVDRSINGPDEFIHTNILGTYNLLECAREYWLSLSDSDKTSFRLHHVSTDEVYGSLEHGGSFTESTQYKPNSPYAASKASSDHLVRAWHRTFGLPVVTTNCSNNYGPYQFPEKLIPLIIFRALNHQQLPIYGAGDNIRDWIYVEDHVRALWLVFTAGENGEVYNIGGNCEKTNIEVVDSLCAILDEIKPRLDGISYKSQKVHVNDRLGHDKRYSVDINKIYSKLNWTPSETFESGLRKTAEWYLQNLEWINHVT